MHLCFLTPEYPNAKLKSSGGLGTSIKNLAVQLVKQGIQVSIVVTGQKDTVQFTEDGIHFYALKHIKYPIFGFYLYRKRIQRFVSQLIQDQGIDLVEAPDWTGMTAFMKLKAPVIIRFHGTDAYFCKLDGRPQKLKNYWFERLALRKADHLISVSAFTAQLTKDLFNLKQPMKVIPNSIDTTQFQSQHEKVQSNRVLYFGTVIRKKGVLELAAIFNQVNAAMPEVSFIFAGKDAKDVLTGQSTQAMVLEAMNASTQAQSQFLGALPYERIQEEIAKATVVVLPSFAEALPMTWLEAMAMEKALVTSDIGWAEEVMVDGETGFMVHPKKHDAFAKRIVELLQNIDLRLQLGQAARSQVARNFSSEVVTQNNIEYYKQLL